MRRALRGRALRGRALCARPRSERLGGRAAGLGDLAPQRMQEKAMNIGLNSIHIEISNV